MSKKANSKLCNQKRQERPKVSGRSQLEEPEIRYKERIVRSVHQRTTDSTQSPRRRTREKDQHRNQENRNPSIIEPRKPDIIERTLYQVYQLYRNLSKEQTLVELVEENQFRQLGLIYPPECIKRETDRIRAEILITAIVLITIYALERTLLK